MLKGVQGGYELPEYISEEQYKYIRENKDEDKVLTGFVGFGCSFGGKWFGGYARSKKYRERNRFYSTESKHSLMKDMQYLQNVQFTCKDYREVEIPPNSIVYADPPYNATTKFTGTKDFDTVAFWEYMRKISKDNLVFISEQNAPDDFIAIWEKPLLRQLDSNKDNMFMATERLYIHKDTYEKLREVERS